MSEENTELKDSLIQQILEKEDVKIVDTEKNQVHTKDDPPPKEEDDPDKEPIKEPDKGSDKKADEPDKDADKQDDEPDKKPETPEITIEVFNQSFGTEFNEEEFNSIKEDIPKLKEYKEAIKLTDVVKELNGKIKAAQDENEELKSLYDPKKIFVSDAEYNRQQLLRKYPDYDPSVITKIINADVSKLSPFESLKLKTLLEDGDIYKSERDVEEMIADKYDIDISEQFSDLESLKRNKILKDAKEANKVFSNLKAGDGEESKLDILADREAKQKERDESYRKLKDDWKPLIEKIPDQISDLNLSIKDEDGEEHNFVFKVEDDFKGKIKSNIDSIVDGKSKLGVEASTENTAKLIGELTDVYTKINLNKIIQAAVTFGSTLKGEKIIKEKDNPKPPKRDDEPPEKLTVDQEKENAIKDQLNRALGIG